jgi:SPP1 gp7 family putative phage head morphogenesis protein
VNATERLRDLAIRHGVYLERYTRSEAKELAAMLEQSISELTAKIEKTGGAYTKRWLRSIVADTKGVLAETRKALEAKLFDDARLLAEYEAERVRRDWEAAIPLKIEVATVSPDSLLSAIRDLPASAGSTLGDLFDKWELGTVQAFTAQVRLGVAQGETVGQMVRRIRGKATGRRGVYDGGVLQTSTRNATALVRTAVAHVNTLARERFYDANSDLIKGYQYTATLDARTCLECAPLDGRVYGAGEFRPALPQHFNCRCMYVPVVKSWKELGLDIEEAPEGTRASMNGQVPATLTYQQWLAQQSTAVQNDVLGKGRAELFRAGTPLADMRDRAGNVLTLAQLRDLDK